MNIATYNTRNALVIGSPLLIVALGSVAARVSIEFLGQWAWAGAVPIYWISMAFVIAVFAGRERLTSWFGASRPGLLWPALAILVGLSSFPLLLLPNLHLLNSPPLVVLWLLFALINGPLEEAYWRGFLFNEIQGWPRWLVVLYSSALFVVIHFLMLGSFAPSLFNPAFFVILVGITAVYSLIFLRTGSLRWPAVSHVLNDLGNLNIFVFMNLIGLAMG